MHPLELQNTQKYKILLFVFNSNNSVQTTFSTPVQCMCYLEKFRIFKVPNKGPFVSTGRQTDNRPSDFGTKLMYPFFLKKKAGIMSYLGCEVIGQLLVVIVSFRLLVVISRVSLITGYKVHKIMFSRFSRGSNLTLL